MYKVNFQERIKKARIDAGYTQQQVADLLQVSQSKIAQIESGRIEPDIETLGRLAEFYNVSIDWLLGFSPKEPTSKPKANLFDKTIAGGALYSFVIKLPIRDMVIFLSGQMSINQFWESDQYKKLSPDQQLYLIEEFNAYQWEKDRDQWLKQLKKDGYWTQEPLRA